MYDFLARKGQTIAFGIGVLITAIFLGIAFGGQEQFEALADDQRITTDIFNFGLQAAIALIVICAVIAIAFGLFHTLSNPKGAIKGIASLAVIAAIFFIGQSMAGADSPGVVETMREFGVSAAEGSFINGALMSVLALGALAALAFVVSELLNFLK